MFQFCHAPSALISRSRENDWDAFGILIFDKSAAVSLEEFKIVSTESTWVVIVIRRKIEGFIVVKVMPF